MTLLDGLSAAAIEHPDKRVMFPKDDVEISVAGLLERADIAAATLASMGVGRGKLVGLLLPNSCDLLATFFATMRTGGAPTCLPLPTSMRQLASYGQRLAGLIERAGIEHLVVDASFKDMLTSAIDSVRVLTPDELMTSEHPLVSTKLAPDDLAMVQFSSGSTAAPKGVALTHRNLSAGLSAIIRGSGLGPDDLLMQWLPLFHDMGLIGLLAGLTAGMSAVVYPPTAFIRDPGGWLVEFSKRRATVTTGPSFGYRYMLENVTEEQLAELDLSRWRVAYNGAEPVDPLTVDRFIARFGPVGFATTTMFPVYGLAEATLAVTFPRLDEAPHFENIDRQVLRDEGRAQRVDASHDNAWRLCGLGRPVPGVAIQIANGDGSVMPDGRTGEVCISGAPISARYFADEAATDASRRGEWFRTGDIGFVLDGRLFITGRHKNMIIIHGANYHPEDAEAIVRAIDGVHRGRCGAVAAPTTERMIIVAETLRDPDHRPALAQHILAQVRAGLGIDAIDVCLVDRGTIPLTTSGKVRRDALVELHQGV